MNKLKNTKNSRYAVSDLYVRTISASVPQFDAIPHTPSVLHTSLVMFRLQECEALTDTKFVTFYFGKWIFYCYEDYPSVNSNVMHVLHFPAKWYYLYSA